MFVSVEVKPSAGVVIKSCSCIIRFFHWHTCNAKKTVCGKSLLTSLVYLACNVSRQTEPIRAFCTIWENESCGINDFSTHDRERSS